MIRVKKYFKQLMDDSFKQITSFGSYQGYLIYSIIFLLVGFIEEFVFLFTGLILLYVIAIPLRLLFFRERPIAKKYNNFIEKINASSFPSLHSARSVFLLLFFINFFNREILISIFLVVLVGLILYSRIYRGKHYLGDIFGGVVLGSFVYGSVSLII